MRNFCFSALLTVLVAMAGAGQTVSTSPAGNTFRISGTAVNAVDGSPLSGVEITIAAAEQRDDSKQMVTGADGRFAFENLARGKYSLSGTVRGFVLQAYQQHDQYSTAVATGPGLISENLIFSMTPDASISGTVIDEDDEPVREGEVVLFERSSDEDGEMRVMARNGLDGQGRYRFGHLHAGSYFVAVIAQPWYAQDSPPPIVVRESAGRVETSDSTADAPKNNVESDRSGASLDVVYPITFYPNVTEAEDAAPIELRAGEHATAGLTLRAEPGIHLRIVNGSRDPAAPLTTVLEQRVLGMPVQVASRGGQASNGTLTLSGIAPGHLILSIRHFNGKEWLSLNKEVDVTGDTEIDASESSVGDVAIKGVVRRSGSAPVPVGAFVRFWNRATGENFGGQVDEKGEFEVSQGLTSTTAYNVAVANAANLLLQDISAAGARVVGQTIYLPRGGPVALSLTLSEASGRIDGTVLQDGKPVAESMVLLVPQHPTEEPTLFRRDQSDSDGTFTLRQILPGRYTVVAIEKGWEINWHNPNVLKPYLDRGEVVDVAANRRLNISVKWQPREASSASAGSAIQ